MKKLFKFFVATAIIAVGFMGCSEETPVPTPDPTPTPEPTPGVVEEVPTYATFTFQFEGATPSTRAMVTDVYEGDAPTTTFSTIRLLVFEVKANDAGLCLADTLITAFASGNNPPEGQSATVLVTSGQKRLLVIANSGAAASDVNTALNNGLSGTQPLKGTTYADFLASHNLYDIGSPAIAAGIPVASLDFTSLVNTTTGAGTLLYSNTLDDASSLKTLLPNIAYATSRDATGSETVKEASNKFEIKVKRAVAKAVAYYSKADGQTTNYSNATDAGKGGTLSNLTYNIRNINRGLLLFQKNLSSGPEAAYYNAFGTPAVDNLVPFIPYFYKDNDISIALQSVSQAPKSAGDGIYLTESNSAGGFHGAKAYFAFKGKYVPAPETQVVSITGYDYTMNGQFTYSTEDASSAISQSTPNNGTFFVLSDSAYGPLSTSLTAGTALTTISFPARTVFKDSVSIKKVVWAKQNPGLPLPADADFSGTGTIHLLSAIKEYAFHYKEGYTYYRLNLYEGSDYKSKNYVARNNHYLADVTGFSDLGAPDIEDLDTNPGGTNEQPTYVTATITVLDWVEVPTQTVVNPWPED